MKFVVGTCLVLVAIPALSLPTGQSAPGSRVAPLLQTLGARGGKFSAEEKGKAVMQEDVASSSRPLNGEAHPLPPPPEPQKPLVDVPSSSRPPPVVEERPVSPPVQNPPGHPAGAYAPGPYGAPPGPYGGYGWHYPQPAPGNQMTGSPAGIGAGSGAVTGAIAGAGLGAVGGSLASSGSGSGSSNSPAPAPAPAPNYNTYPGYARRSILVQSADVSGGPSSDESDDGAPLGGVD